MISLRPLQMLAAGSVLSTIAACTLVVAIMTK